jgi:hypothetical protein
MAKYRSHQEYDVLRGGTDVILYDDKDRPVAGVYSTDHEHRVTYEVYDERTPGQWLASLCSRAWWVLDPFPDGTPLIKGKMPAWFRKFERPAHLVAAAKKRKIYYDEHKAEYSARYKRKRLERKAAEAAKKRKAAAARSRKKGAARKRPQRAKGSSGS